jgi:homoserine dehydrogenase
MKPINVGLLGIGTVGGGTFSVLQRNGGDHPPRRPADPHFRRRRQEPRTGEAGHRRRLPPDRRRLRRGRRPDIDIVVELIGGYGVAKELVLKAIENGKHVVTANKALLATHGNEIFAAAQKQGVMVAFEAAVAGGIPIIKALREGLTANRIEWIAGIINGTTNFILSEMRDKGLPFDVGAEGGAAPRLRRGRPDLRRRGRRCRAQADHHVGHRLRHPDAVRQGARRGHLQADAEDIKYAEQLGYRIKLLGHHQAASAEGVELRVHPTLIPAKRLIANVEGAMNAVLVKGDAVGATLYYGKGAGAEPTASAVIADLVDVTRMHTADPENRVPHLAFQPDAMENTPILPLSEVETSYYLRLRVEDKPGVLADITRILADQQISIDAMIQREPGEGESQTDIIMLTHVTRERNVDAAIVKIEALPVVSKKVIRLRMEELG